MQKQTHISKPLLQSHRFAGDTLGYTAPSWHELNKLIFAITQEIVGEEFVFDQVITLAKGGWPLARVLVDYLQIETVSSIGMRSYTGIDARDTRPTIYQDLPATVAGQSILLFDDVADSGESLLFAQEYLQQQGAGLIKTATAFYKPHSKIIPDYYGALTQDWIIFPYEFRETLAALAQRWREQECSEAEIVTRLTTFGFDPQMTLFFLNTID